MPTNACRCLRWELSEARRLLQSLTTRSNCLLMGTSLPKTTSALIAIGCRTACITLDVSRVSESICSAKYARTPSTDSTPARKTGCTCRT